MKMAPEIFGHVMADNMPDTPWIFVALLADGRAKL